jgi:acetyltransferase-like isoleucine patch superfamily enzyme
MNAAALHTLYRDARDRAFSLTMRSSFASFGPRSRISLPTQLHGTERISVGNHVYLGPGCWLLTHELDGAGGPHELDGAGGPHELDGAGGRIEIGDCTSIAGYCVLSAAVRVSIGRGVLFARNVYIADHRHGFQLADRAILDQPLEDLRAVVVEDDAWLGQNVVLLPGVTVGRGAVVGANSVIREDVPPRCVVAGAPGRVVRQLPSA